MATNNAFKITKDVSARKNTRVGSIQSAVEAAARKESHDYYLGRLTEGYKLQLETMEEAYEEQIQDLKSQLNTSFEKGKDEATMEAAAKLSEQIQAADLELLGEQQAHNSTRGSLASAMQRAEKAEKAVNTMETRYRAQIVKQTKHHEAELEKAHREKNTGPFRWIEIKFIKRHKTKNKMAEPKFAVKKAGAKFSELVQTALTSKSVYSWAYEYQGRTLSLADLKKTLTQVSLVPLHRAILSEQ
jgi:excinuclease UvrABC nuclease subunit